MTDEEIKQRAKRYAETYVNKTAAYIGGAHSRDEEIECLAKNYKEEFDAQEEELDSLRKGFYERGEKLKELMLANNQLRNPWISVEKRLPEEDKGEFSKKVNVRIESSDGVFYSSDCYDYQKKCWEHCSNITHWMPIPQLKKGE